MRPTKRALLLLLLALGLTVGTPVGHDAPVRAAISAAHLDHATLPTRLEDRASAGLDLAQPLHPSGLPATLPPHPRPAVARAGATARALAPYTGVQARTTRGPPTG